MRTIRLALFLSCIFLTSVLAKNPPKKLEDARKFVTRPDIEAPNFQVTVHDNALVTPGYWFIAQYDALNHHGGKYTGAHIFDGTGELVWSGATLGQRYDVHDFRVSNVLGEDMLTMIHHHNRTAIVLDTAYDVRQTIKMTQAGQDLNMHELYFIDNGTRALLFHDTFNTLTQEQSDAIGYTGDRCPFRDNSFRELDVVNDWERSFMWHASNHVSLQENYHGKKPFPKRCEGTGNWDMYHANSIDKFPAPDNNYLVSIRHTDTIYKIDSTDGKIIWRFGGRDSDFKHRDDFYFLSQHHARILEHNATHTILSYFDNAVETAHRPASHPRSRVLIVALRTDVQPMTAEILRQYGHPGGEGTYANARGSAQVLPNGNVFTNWVYRMWHTEHTEDGKLVLEAKIKQPWLKSYRSYKFSFVGQPSQPPDVSSTEHVDEAGKSSKTVVHVSWNGATEVDTWNVYKRKLGLDVRFWGDAKPVASAPRSGFETALTSDGIARYVVVEAVDKNGKILGRSKVVKTTQVTETPIQDWLEDWIRMFVLGALAAPLLFGVAWVVQQKRWWKNPRFRSGPRYQRVADGDEEMDVLEKRTGRSADTNDADDSQVHDRTPSSSSLEELQRRRRVSAG